MVVLRERLGEFALRVLHTVAFIYTNTTSLMNAFDLPQSKKPTNDHVYPTILAKHRPILDDVLIGGEEDLEISTQLILQLRRAFGDPLYEMTFSIGTHLANSRVQFMSVDTGTIPR